MQNNLLFVQNYTLDVFSHLIIIYSMRESLVELFRPTRKKIGLFLILVFVIPFPHVVYTDFTEGQSWSFLPFLLPFAIGMNIFDLMIGKLHVWDNLGPLPWAYVLLSYIASGLLIMLYDKRKKAQRISKNS